MTIRRENKRRNRLGKVADNRDDRLTDITGHRKSLQNYNRKVTRPIPLKPKPDVEEFIWVDKDKNPPTPYHDSADYKRSIQGIDSNISLLHTIRNDNSNRGGSFVMLIDENVNSNALDSHIQTWAQDVINDNDHDGSYAFNEVGIFGCAGNCDVEFIISWLGSSCNGDCPDLKGALLVGDLGVSWKIRDDEWNTIPREFPTSKPLFDLGIYVGYLKTGGCGGGEDCLDWSLGGYSNVTDALISYFEKNHEYRTTSSEHPNLIFNDDWITNGFGEYEYNVVLNFSPLGIDYFSSWNNTNAEDFSTEMDFYREFSFASGHGNPHGISFTANNCGNYPDCSGCTWSSCDSSGDCRCYNQFSYYDLLDLSQISQFHIWESCSVGRFTEVNNLANWYVFHPNGGLVTWAATDNIFPMQWPWVFMDYDDNYGWRNIGQSIAFKIQQEDSSHQWDRIVILGDPTLIITDPVAPDFTCWQLGDINADGLHNVLDIVDLANCVLNNNCSDKGESCAWACDMDGNGFYNVLDIVQLANCVINQNCADSTDSGYNIYAPPPGWTEEEHINKITEILNIAQEAVSLGKLNDPVTLNKILDIGERKAGKFNKNNRHKYKAPVKVSQKKNDDMVSKVLDMLNELKPVGGYSTGTIGDKDKQGLNAILDYLAGEGIRPVLSPSKSSAIRRK